MKISFLNGLLASLTVVFSFSPAVQAATSLQALEKGELDITLVDAAQDYIQAKGIFNASPEKAWKVLTDFKNFPTYYESVVKSEIRTQQGNTRKVYVKFSFPFPVGEIWVVNQYTLDAAARRLSWKMLEGNLKNSDGAGSWNLAPYKGGRTLATYRLNVDSSGASNWLQKQAFYRSTPAVFKRLNQYMR